MPRPPLRPPDPHQQRSPSAPPRPRTRQPRPSIAAAQQPDLSAEAALWAEGLTRVAGADAVGLGCLSGPVVAAAVIVVPDCLLIEGVRDSKMLTAAQRQRLVGEILTCATAVGVGAASVAEIECINVRNAEILAVRRALRRLGAYDYVLIDGRPHKNIDFGPYTAIVDGDATSYSIACASIVAKVVRDRLMRKLGARHPEYGWEHNVGYSTRQHLDAIEEHGPTPYHRRTYAPVKSILSGGAVQMPLPDPTDHADRVA